MADTMRKVDEREDFWRPPTANATRDYQRPVAAQLESCPACGADLVMGSRFCHVCGNGRYEKVQHRKMEWPRWLNLRRLSEIVGLRIPSLVSMLIGIACVFVAITTGVIFSAATVLDWQAVQVWRIEWLLAAVAAFLAGILLKGPAES